jgi:hypothetical protein
MLSVTCRRLEFKHSLHYEDKSHPLYGTLRAKVLITHSAEKNSELHVQLFSTNTTAHMWQKPWPKNKMST